MKKETMAFVGHEHAAQLLHNKCVVVIGDSIQRSVYKDMVLLLQRDSFLSQGQLRSKGELTFESDALVEGGCRDKMHNGAGYREVRQFRSQNHLVRFYFVTRVFSRYMQSVLEDLRSGPPPDMVLVNSCVWDISRYKAAWAEDYTEHLHRFFGGLKEVLPQETLVVWNLTMPLGRKILGGFLTPEVASRAGQLRFDVVEANFCSGVLAGAYGSDVLDLHFNFRLSLQQRTRDGIHWNALAHRRMTSLMLRHAAAAWGVGLPAPPPATPPATPGTAVAALGSRSSSLAQLYPAAAPQVLRKINFNRWHDNVVQDFWQEAPNVTYQHGCTGLEKDKQPIKEALQPPYQRQAYSHRTAREYTYSTPATVLAPNFQPYPSDQNPPRYVMRNRHAKRRQEAPYSHRPNHVYFP